MTTLAKAFAINPDKIRIRSFEYNGEQFKVRVPLTQEAESMFERVDNPPAELIKAKFDELTRELYAKKQEIIDSKADIKFKKDDVVVGDQSLLALAKSQASGEIRILESIKLLVPVNGANLGDITYDQIQEEFPLPVQLSLVKKIAEIVSPAYEDVRKN
jgi:hypothetical protein